MLGGQSVDAKAPLLKNFKKPLQQAAAAGLVQEGKAKVSVVGKNGKTSSKQLAVVGLTEEGVALLRQAASPEALAATGAGHLSALRQSLEADRQQLRAEVAAALKPAGKGPDEKKIQKGIDDLAKKLEQFAVQLK